MNTIEVIYREPKKKSNFCKKTILFGVRILGATIASWIVIILIYEIPCFLGKTTEIDLPVIRAAVAADYKVNMKYRIKSYAANRLINELEEIKIFYSQF